MRNRIVAEPLGAGWLLLLATGFVVCPLSGADYFLSASGDDAAQGHTTNTAWRSIERVNRAQLRPGDRVLFEAGRRFAGNLRLTEEDAGTAEARVVIGSFGDGRATLLRAAAMASRLRTQGASRSKTSSFWARVARTTRATAFFATTPWNPPD